MTNSQSVPKQQSQNPELTFSCKLQKKTELLEKFELLDKRGFKLMETRKKDGFLPPSPSPFLD